MKPIYLFVNASQATETPSSWLSHDPQTVNKPPSENDKKATLGNAHVEANTYSLWRGRGFNYLFSLLSKVHVRWVSHWDLSITSSIPARAHGGSAEPGTAAHFLLAIRKT